MRRTAGLLQIVPCTSINGRLQDMDDHDSTLPQRTSALSTVGSFRRVFRINSTCSVGTITATCELIVFPERRWWRSLLESFEHHSDNSQYDGHSYRTSDTGAMRNVGCALPQIHQGRRAEQHDERKAVLTCDGTPSAAAAAGHWRTQPNHSVIVRLHLDDV